MRGVFGSKKYMARTAWTKPQSLSFDSCNDLGPIHLRTRRLWAFCNWHWATWYGIKRTTVLGTNKSLVLEFWKRYQVLVWCMSHIKHRDSNFRRQERRELIIIVIYFWHAVESDCKDRKHAEQGYFLLTHLPLQEREGVCLRIWERKCLHLLDCPTHLGQEVTAR